MNAAYSIEAATIYWITAYGSARTDHKYDSVGGHRGCRIAAIDFPDPFGAPSNCYADRKVSIYITYTAGNGGPDADNSQIFAANF